MDTQQSNTARNVKQSNARNTLTTIMIMIVIFIAIRYWYNNTHYNSSFQNNFMTNCEGGGSSVSGCSCAYNVLQNEYTYSQAKAMDANPNSINGQAWKASVVNQCGTH